MRLLYQELANFAIYSLKVKDKNTLKLKKTYINYYQKEKEIPTSSNHQIINQTNYNKDTLFVPLPVQKYDHYYNPEFSVSFPPPLSLQEILLQYGFETD